MQQHSASFAHEYVGRVKGFVESPVAFAKQLPVNEVVDFVTGLSFHLFLSGLLGLCACLWAFCLVLEGSKLGDLAN